MEKCSSCRNNNNSGKNSLDIFMVSPIIIKPDIPSPPSSIPIEKTTTIKVSTPISEKIDEENARITYLTGSIQNNNKKHPTTKICVCFI